MFSAARVASKIVSAASNSVTTTITATTSTGTRRFVSRCFSQSLLLPRVRSAGKLRRCLAQRFSSKTSSSSSASSSSSSSSATAGEGLFRRKWKSPEFWGGLGAVAGWGMSAAAVYDASSQGPEVISLTMTPVMLIYSSLFARWAWVVRPRNLFLMWCHVFNIAAQSNQMRRAIQHKLDNGEEDEVKDIALRAGAGIALVGALVAGGPTLQSFLVGANLGPVSVLAAAPAGPFTVHFWGPVSKWLISGASFLDLNRPTDKISLSQYTALTLTGLFFSRYSLLVRPVNYMLCSVNIALFSSSAWHLGRKIKADYIDLADFNSVAKHTAQDAQHALAHQVAAPLFVTAAHADDVGEREARRD